jgi:anti-sigma factor RsiW
MTGESMAVPADDLTCRELVELVTEYLDGVLAPAETARFEAHLAHCPECRGHVEDMRLTIRLVGRVTEQSLSPAVEAELVAAFRGWRRG